MSVIESGIMSVVNLLIHAGVRVSKRNVGVSVPSRGAKLWQIFADDSLSGNQTVAQILVIRTVPESGN